MSEQQVKPLWTDDAITDYMQEHSWWQPPGQGSLCTTVAHAVETAIVLRDKAQAALDAANARIAELEGQRIDAMEVAGAILYDALLDDESEADIEAQQQPNADGLLPCPWCLKTPRKINKPNSTIIVCWVESCLVAPAVECDNENAAIAAWNRRATVQQPDSPDDDKPLTTEEIGELSGIWEAQPQEGGE